jgi:hypothetical protein
MAQAMLPGLRQRALDFVEREAERLRLQDHGQRFGRTLVIFAVARRCPPYRPHQAFILEKADFRGSHGEPPRQFTDLHRRNLLQKALKPALTFKLG